jgi:hypothetical protein
MQMISLFKRMQKKGILQYFLYEYLIFDTTVDPVYSELGYREYPLIVNGFLRTDR